MRLFETTSSPLRPLIVGTAILLSTGCQAEQTAVEISPSPKPPSAQKVRIALFNIRELNTSKITQVDQEGIGSDKQTRAAANIIQRVRPDILIINEIDHDYDHLDEGYDLNARLFAKHYLETGKQPLTFPHSYASASNTGILTGLDVNNDGVISTDAARGQRSHGDDCFGWGRYPGEFSMAVLSQYPIITDAARTFRKMLWRDLPGNHIPPAYYRNEVLEILRLSSKSHWDLPVQVGTNRLHLLLSHPTPQGFDGDEDKNGRRNFDEIKFWADYLDGSEAIYDDRKIHGGYATREPFVIAGDLNARPSRSSDLTASPSWRLPSVYDGKTAIAQLLEHPLIQDSGRWVTSSRSLGEQAAGAPNFPERATSNFGTGARIDYVLPSSSLQILDGGVFWPDETADPEGASWAEEASDHRLVWVDLSIPVS
jgi:endonuclease/exonuclease/phosphatase family metal-dependent hydrolase